MERYNGIVEEILWYSERSTDGRWIIPIEVDFDYTLTRCSSWEQGTMDLNYDAFKVMKRWSRDYNVGWILNTMRQDNMIQEPLKMLKDNNVELYGVRKHPLQEEDEVTKSFAVFCIDDRNVGTPHKWIDGCNRPHVDWEEVDRIMSPILEHITKELKNKT